MLKNENLENRMGTLGRTLAEEMDVRISYSEEERSILLTIYRDGEILNSDIFVYDNEEDYHHDHDVIKKAIGEMPESI